MFIDTAHFLSKDTTSSKRNRSFSDDAEGGGNELNRNNLISYKLDHMTYLPPAELIVRLYIEEASGRLLRGSVEG